MRSLMPAFQKYPDEGKLIGEMVSGYGELEYGLALAVGQMIDNVDVALKVMFRAPGENARILLADALARSTLPGGKTRTLFEQTIAGMHVCRKIRNHYAHSNWGHDADGLWFVDVSEMASQHGETDSADLVKRLADLPLLTEQYEYFCYIDDCIGFLNFDGQLRHGGISVSPIPTPPPFRGPPKIHH